MTVSVLVTSHNYRDFVVEAVESALAQDPPPYEIIIVDDGSTDGSVDLLQARYGTHPQVRIVCTPNRGQLAAFVAGFRLSRGDVIAFLDADDRYRPGYLKRVTEILAAFPSVNQVFCNVEKFGQGQGVWLPYVADADWGMAALQVWMRFHFYGVPTSGISLRRDLCGRVLSLPDRFQPDWRTRADDCLVYGGALLGAHRYFIAEPLVEYRVHQANNWLGATLPPVEALRYRMRMSRLLAWYAQEAGLHERMLRWAVFEFKTKPRRRFDELLSYFWLQSRAAMPPRLKLRAYGALCKHYLRSLLRPGKG